MRFCICWLGVSMWIFACDTNTANEQAIAQLLTRHAWQLTAESEVHAAAEYLTDNIVEFTPQGFCSYYDDWKNRRIFTQNQWKWDNSRKKLVEIFANNTRIENEVLEISASTLRIRRTIDDEAGKPQTIIETYRALAE